MNRSAHDVRHPWPSSTRCDPSSTEHAGLAASVTSKVITCVVQIPCCSAVVGQRRRRASRLPVMKTAAPGTLAGGFSAFASQELSKGTAAAPERRATIWRPFPRGHDDVTAQHRDER